MRKLAWCTAALLLLSCSACRRPALYPARGTVTYRGEPAAGAVVYLHRKDGVHQYAIAGSVQEDGVFELVCGSFGKGVPPGEYDVLIAWSVPCATGNGCCQRRADKLAGRYNNPRDPKFHAIVEPKENRLPAFELE